MVDSRFSTFSIIENYFWNYTYKESMNLIINAVTNCHFLNDCDFPSYKQMTLYDLSLSLSLDLSLDLSLSTITKNTTFAIFFFVFNEFRGEVA